MNRRIDLGSAVTAFVLIAMLGVALVMAPKAKVPPLTRMQKVDSALNAAFSTHATSNLQGKGHFLSILMPYTPAQPSPDDSIYALAERVARVANAQYGDTAVEGISVLFMQPNGYSGAGFLPPLLDGRATPVAISPAEPFSDLEAAVRTLPLTTGYAARLPMRWADRSPEVVWQSIYVVGVDSACRCWEVNTAGVRGGFRRLKVPLKS
jgi:hypothetical protein